jgi:hypothetical protein
LETLKGKDIVEDLGVDGRIMLKSITKKSGVMIRVDSSDSG